MAMTARSRVVFGAVAALVVGCASVPQQAVDLSVTAGRDLDAVHRAHIALLDSYFDRMESDVNAFVDSEYRTYSIERNMKDFKLVDKIRDPSTAGEGLDALDVMEVFVEEIVADVEAFRASLLGPVRAQRAEVRTAIEDAYRRIQDAQAIVTGHLASVRRVHDLQDEMLARAGLEGLREKFVDTTAKSADAIAKLTKETEYVSGKMVDFQKELEKLKATTGALKK
ncbi:hypothetical protein [Anaeromyxobacter soli]|uniref:hypothetical protein n=1 Tax=Anaeromyxobacter soli TaxID=2922725 RepID=UPI001FAEF06D|nr:hypothetical protein [Anaeromyxobacter sp. SG29]